MTRRPITILTIAAIAAIPAASVASAKNGSDDVRGTSPSKSEQRAGAGTVTSFDGSQLVITLADGSTISGRVTRRTEIECSRALGARRSAYYGSGGDSHGSDDRGADDRGGKGHGSDDAPGDDRGGKGHGSDDVKPTTTTPDDSPDPTTPAGTTPAGTTPAATTPAGTTPAATTPGGRPRCGRALLVPGASVRKSRVRAGAFKKVHLYR